MDEEALVKWIGDTGPDPIPSTLLDRVMYVGTPTTARDGSRIPIEVEGPQAHLAIQGADTTPLSTHFHAVEQFQLFVAGSGTVGPHRVGAGVVHYTDRNTVYGPLRPGPDGMTYATLRARHDTGARFMPQARGELAERLRRAGGAPRRNVAVRLEGTDDLVAARDGLRIAVIEVGPGSAVEIGMGGGGGYLAVLAGSVVGAGGLSGAGAIAWGEAGAGLVAEADRDGARLALLQFPEAAARPGD